MDFRSHKDIKVTKRKKEGLLRSKKEKENILEDKKEEFPFEHLYQLPECSNGKEMAVGISNSYLIMKVLKIVD